ncbi:MAG: hypothetical protein JSR76_04530 [Verrucomicrobia bacterium]|nr:hypothetical protein [Verrucomicrobiota bacterium]
MNKTIALALLLAAPLFAGEWDAEAAFGLILEPPVVTTTSNNVFLTYNSLTGEVLATWGDTNYDPANPPPTYAFYNGAGWSYNSASNIPLTISTASSVASDLYTAFNPVTGEFLATWADSLNSNLPTYSIYNPNSGWSAPTSFYSNGAGGDERVYCIYNPVSNSFFAAWEDDSGGPDGEPFYAIYSNGSWSTPLPISTIVLVHSADVYLSCNPTTGEVLAAWRDTSNVANYAIYNGSSWSSAAVLAASPTVQENILSCFDVTSNRFMAVWADFSGANNPYYSFYDPVNGWTTAAPISLTSGVDTNVAISQDTASGALLATWLEFNSPNQSPAYSLYNGASWTEAAFISEAASSNSDDCFTCYDSAKGRFFAGWVDMNNSSPNYSIYSFSSNIAPLEPASFSGVQKTNGFGVVQERYNVLSWEKSSNVSSYNLFRNNVLIAVLDGSATFYEDHDQPSKNQLYSLIAVNNFGNSSTALVIVGGQ